MRGRVVLRQAAKGHPRRYGVIQAEDREIRNEAAVLHLHVVPLILDLRGQRIGGAHSESRCVAHARAAVKILRHPGEPLVEPFRRTRVVRQARVVEAVRACRNGHVPMDFERRIFVKRMAGEVLQRTLSRTPIGADQIALGTATDPYQPAERKFKLTRLSKLSKSSLNLYSTSRFKIDQNSLAC